MRRPRAKDDKRVQFTRSWYPVRSLGKFRQSGGYGMARDITVGFRDSRVLNAEIEQWGFKARANFASAMRPRSCLQVFSKGR